MLLGLLLGKLQALLRVVLKQVLLLVLQWMDLKLGTLRMPLSLLLL